VVAVAFKYKKLIEHRVDCGHFFICNGSANPMQLHCICREWLCGGVVVVQQQPIRAVLDQRQMRRLALVVAWIPGIPMIKRTQSTLLTGMVAGVVRHPGSPKPSGHDSRWRTIDYVLVARPVNSLLRPSINLPNASHASANRFSCIRIP
jgi:hypothetical protein